MRETGRVQDDNEARGGLKIMKRLALLTLVMAAAAGMAVAELRVDRTVPLSSDGTLSIEMISGFLTIEGKGRDGVEITGVLRHDCEELDVMARGDRVEIEVDWVCDGHHRMRGQTELTIRLPRDAHLEVETISADIDVSGTGGDLDIESISGTIDVRGDSRSMDVASVSGRINVVSSTPLEEGDFETISGRIEAEIEPARSGTIDMEAVSGDIVLRLPRGVSARFDIESFSGGIRNDLGPKARRTSEYLPSKELYFSLGGGSARIAIETLSGGISIEER
jgi:hypothetical protein